MSRLYWVRLQIPVSREEEIAGTIALLDPIGTEQRGSEITAWFHDPDGAARCRDALSPLPVEAGEQFDENWNQAWQSQWQPMQVGARWYLAPPWDASATPEGRIRLHMHPGNAFGNGDHPATHLCLEAMEGSLRPGDRFLDVGCGSGLLCQAAEKLGAAVAAGCDPDEAAIAQARSYGVNTTWIGSIDAVAGSFDFIAANLPAGILLALLGDLGRIAGPGARMAVSGLLAGQVGKVEAAIAGGWMALTERERGGWHCIELTRA
ncbi:MAG: 50S ribosomal protein L11 methyltransferase [Bryobacteraceae bacterium]